MLGSVMDETIARAICNNWNTVYYDEHIGTDWEGRGQGFSIYDLIDDEFEINFHDRKEWWIPGERVADVKNIVKQKLMDAGINPTKLKVYGKTHIISWMNNRKYIAIHRIKFVENIKKY